MGLQRVRHDWASFIFISFHFQWIFRFDPLAVQGTLKSLLQHCSSKASILWHLVLGIHWKDWCWSWNSNTLATWCRELTHFKDPYAGKDWGQEEKGMTEDEMVRWHHQLNGHGFGWTLGVGDGQGGLACCSSWGRKESDMTERLNWTEQLSL